MNHQKYQKKSPILRTSEQIFRIKNKKEKTKHINTVIEYFETIQSQSDPLKLIIKKMKFVSILLIGFTLVLLSTVNISEAYESLKEFNQLQNGLTSADFGVTNGEPVELNRQKRLTCDINRSFCIAHCLLRGYKRGLCTQSKICVCRN